ncbi:dual specificity protein phosphatase (DsPTP1) family protein [Actinidia rufa]|uniref:Dual specificity protein phosphatase (DsPTP1) family protein n=1 Tax=Actinidia rufa TaxID=165716 RepID=A0A7J0EDA6_9ERIC|nr:dual specificity protein phosphatase (DsPTP1) family protein [Actinidia rufa]
MVSSKLSENGVEEKNPTSNGVSGSKSRMEEYNIAMKRMMRNPYEYHHDLGMNYTWITNNLIVGSQPQKPEDIDHLKEECFISGIMVSLAIALDAGILKHFHGINLVLGSLNVLGPLWTGPLHDTTHMTEMLKLAEQWRWTSSGAGLNLEMLLKRMIDESDPELPPGYIKLAEITRVAKVNCPPIKTIMSTMHKEGYAVCRSHIISNAIKTNCPMATCVRIVKELDGAQ